jgi:rRNA maturation RNase YbeY
MEIQITLQQKIPGLRSQKIKQRLKKVLEDLGCRDGELSVLLTDDEHIAELNQHYLGREGPTDVLAFPMAGGPPPHVDSGMLGDVVVSLDTAASESHMLREPLEKTVYRLLIHGILHLLNYDHERSSQEAERMSKEENRLLSLIEA